jgi:hypothetical protein
MSPGHTCNPGPYKPNMPRPHMQPRSYKSSHPQATRITQVMDAIMSLGYTRSPTEPQAIYILPPQVIQAYTPPPHVQPRSYKSIHPQATRITQVMDTHIPLVATHYTPILLGYTCPGHTSLHIPRPYAHFTRPPGRAGLRIPIPRP